MSAAALRPVARKIRDQVTDNWNDKVAVEGALKTRIFGQAGNDTLVGGAGEDTFVTIGGGVDRVRALYHNLRMER